MRIAAISRIVFLVAFLATSWTVAIEPTGIPELALQAMKYRVGKWESIQIVDGVKQAKPGIEVTEWVPGKYAIKSVGFFDEDGKETHGSGLIGWDPERKQLVEHWYTHDGSTAAFLYTLDANKQAGIGTFKWVYSDGKKYEGESVVQVKSDDEWECSASCMVDGQRRTWRTINRRVK